MQKTPVSPGGVNKSFLCFLFQKISKRYGQEKVSFVHTLFSKAKNKPGGKNAGQLNQHENKSVCEKRAILA